MYYYLSKNCLIVIPENVEFLKMLCPSSTSTPTHISSPISTNPPTRTSSLDGDDDVDGHQKDGWSPVNKDQSASHPGLLHCTEDTEHCTLHSVQTWNKQSPIIFHSISNRAFWCLHNSYGTPEFPDCGNLVGADWIENLRWANTEPSMHFKETMRFLVWAFPEVQT